jgi:hypothetical protein
MQELKKWDKNISISQLSSVPWNFYLKLINEEALINSEA